MNNGTRPRATATFVNNLRKEALAEGNTVQAEFLLQIRKMLQDGDYNAAIDFAKRHGFDLETMKYQRSSGPLRSRWKGVVEAYVMNQIGKGKPLTEDQIETVVMGVPDADLEATRIRNAWRRDANAV